VVRRMKNLLVVVSFLVGSAAASVWAEGCPEPLFHPPSARDVVCQPFHGTHQISYLLDESYPGDEALRFIRDRLELLGWLPLAEDFLNPGLKSAHVRGWVDFDDLTTDPHRTVHQWIGDWVDLDGRVVRYVFRYVHPVNAPKDLTTLHVAGILTPNSMAKAEREDVVKNRRLEQ